MRKPIAFRLLAGLLAVLTLFGGFGIVATAAESTGSIREIGGLTDILATIKYQEYLDRNNGKPNHASSSIKIDLLKNFDWSVTSSLCDPNYIRDVICNSEVLSKFFIDETNIENENKLREGLKQKNLALSDAWTEFQNPDKQGEKLLMKDILTNLEKFKEANKGVERIEVQNVMYTEYAKRLLSPAEYFNLYEFHSKNPLKYPTKELTDAEEKDLVVLENIKSFLNNITIQTVMKSDDEGNMFADKDRFKDALTGNTSFVYLPDHDAVGWKITVPEGKEGYYTIKLRYFSIYEEGISKKSSIERSVYIDGAIPFYEAAYVAMSKTYRNYIIDKETGKKIYNIQTGGDFPVDINGNEIRPETEMVECWRDVSIQDSTGFYVEPLKFYLSAGEHTIQLYSQRESVVLGSIELVPSTSHRSYKEYIKYYEGLGAKDVSAEEIADFVNKRNEQLASSIKNENKAPVANDYIKLEAEYTNSTSDATIYPTNDRTSCLTSPQHPAIQYLNTLGGAGSGDQKKWSTVGQWVRYEITVPKSGFYKIALRFNQNTIEGSFVSRKLRVQLAGQLEELKKQGIDMDSVISMAEVPFEEAYYLQFNYGDDWQTSYLNDGEQEFKIYLEEGTNFIELEANLGDMSEVINNISTSLANINAAYIKFLMLAGSSPDKDRDYGFYRRIPDAVRTLSREAANIHAVAEKIVEITGQSGSHVATLEKIVQLLERMGSDEDEIAGNLDSLKSQLGTLGTWISDSKEAPLELDYLAICSGNSGTKELPKAKPGFWQTLWFEFKMFIASFSTDYNTLGLLEESDENESIIVWTTTGRDQANIIRTMINNDFTPNYKVAVALKLVAAGSLLPSVLAGVGPDVSMGHVTPDVINWAIRNALLPITDLGTEEYCKANDIAYDPFFDVQLITGYDNVISAFKGDPENSAVADKAWFNTAAVLPMTLHEVITKADYENLPAEEKKEYEEYDLRYYKDITVDAFEQLDKYTKKKYTPIKDGNDKITGYREYISDKQYKALKGDIKNSYTKEKTSDARYYQKFSLWGLPQEQSFNMLFYRADIFNELGIQPPKTWDDLYGIIGILQSNNMEIAMPTALAGYQMFLYQMGGDLYSNGGQTISFDENLSLEAFETLCHFFQSYKFPIQYDFPNRFRTGEIPMGIVPYTSYTQLSVFATEIRGMWEFIAMPGMYDPNTDTVNNDSTSTTTGIIMMKGAKDRNVIFDAWKFMAWFTSADAQSDYASEVTAVLGVESKHPTANKKSLNELPWTSAERDNLRSQFSDLAGIPEYPGSYIIARYVNFAFLDVYNSNADPIEAIQQYVVTINAELTRKRQEFGLACKEY